MKLFKNQKGFSDVLTMTILSGVIGAIFIGGVFVWKEVDKANTLNSLYSKLSKVIKVEKEATTKNDVLITICTLEKNPTQYLDKNIRVEATVIYTGENYYTDDGEYMLESDNCKIKTYSWAPTTVAHCPPNSTNCKPPKTQAFYINKKLEITGVLKKDNKENYVFSEVSDIIIINPE